VSKAALKIGVLAILAALITVGGFVAYVAWELHHPYAGWEGPSAKLVLEPGLNAGRMLDVLHDAEVVRRPGLLRAWMSFRGTGGSLHAGEYEFASPNSPLEVIERLRRGDVVLHAITIPEGLYLEEVAEQIASAGFAAYDDLLVVFSDPAPIRLLDSKADNLEGYLFPDTYHFPGNVSARQIGQAMVDRFVEVVGKDYVAQAQGVGLSLRQAVTLASMIERETGVPGERARVSRVFHNRIQRRMRMQCDPTVYYALHRAGRPVTRLYSKHLEFESPWNTYRVRGLPPGPIANPGEASLFAAIRPDEGDELFFVARPNGGHVFSKDLPSHQRAVAVWRDYVRSSR
jgi:UPF0755 protein